MSVLSYQILIFVVIVGAGALSGVGALLLATVLACIFTLGRVDTPWLLALQFTTIVVSLLVGAVASWVARQAKTEATVRGIVKYGPYAVGLLLGAVVAIRDYNLNHPTPLPQSASPQQAPGFGLPPSAQPPSGVDPLEREWATPRPLRQPAPPGVPDPNELQAAAAAGRELRETYGRATAACQRLLATPEEWDRCMSRYGF